MAKDTGVKDKIAKLTYDKTKFNKNVLKLKKSVDEINKIISGK
jgi:hypothetical protein